MGTFIFGVICGVVLAVVLMAPFFRFLERILAKNLTPRRKELFHHIRVHLGEARVAAAKLPINVIERRLDLLRAAQLKEIAIDHQTAMSFAMQIKLLHDFVDPDTDNEVVSAIRTSMRLALFDAQTFVMTFHYATDEKAEEKPRAR